MINKAIMVLISGVLLFGLLLGCSYSSEEGQGNNVAAQSETEKATTDSTAKKEEAVVDNTHAAEKSATESKEAATKSASGASKTEEATKPASPAEKENVE